jgi:predicted ATPase/transcriptional regulator with XRE-family HTH domain
MQHQSAGEWQAVADVHARTESFSALLRRYRLGKGLSQEALAAHAGLSVPAIAALERGRRTAPRASTLALLADALSLDGLDRATFIAVARLGSAVETPIDSPAEAKAGTPKARASRLAGMSRLFGREREEATILHLLTQPNDRARFLTLTGPGGVGKTSLASAVASSLGDTFADGSIFVDLSPLRDPELVLDTIARAVGVRETGGRAAGALLREHLRDKQMVLILDNFEHLMEAAPRIAELVGACPQLAVLVTSRAALRVRAEQQFRVAPLLVPTGFRTASVEALGAVAAVRLFVARAQAIEPDFQLTSKNALAVARICYRLDGLPLAIELAAARISLLPPVELLARLERRLPLLTKGARDSPARQQTLRATIEWSYGLVAVEEQLLFRRLSVFVGGCTSTAAEVVCGIDRQAFAVLQGLATLVDHSLLRQDAMLPGEAEPRISMLETLREFAGERLAESGEVEALRHRHGCYYADLAETAEPELYGATKVALVARLAREHDNLRAVLSWAVRHGDLATVVQRHAIGLRVAAALGRFWLLKGDLTEGYTWLTSLLAAEVEDHCPPSVRIKALSGAGWLAHALGDFDQATSLFEQSASLARAHGLLEGQTDLLVNEALEARAVGEYSRATTLLEQCLAWHRATGNRQGTGHGGIGLSLARRALILCEQGEYERAETLYDECMALHQDLGDAGGVAVALLGLGDIARARGEADLVRRYSRESLDIFQNLGERWGIGFALNSMALAALGEDDLAEAEVLAGESVAILREVGSPSAVAEAVTTSAVVACAGGNYSVARTLFAEAMDLANSAGPRWLVAVNLEGQAALALGEGRPARAIELLDEAAALRAAIGAPMPPSSRGRSERVRRAAIDRIDREGATSERSSSMR